MERDWEACKISNGGKNPRCTEGAKHEPRYIKSGVSNVRPAGRMRPANRFNAAREKIFLYVMHAAREQIQCGPREDFLFLLLLLNIFLMEFFLEKKIFWSDKYFLIWCHFFNDFFLEKKLFLLIRPAWERFASMWPVS